jgi:hypothetical protein
VTDRFASAIELASIIVIGLCVLLFGWVLLQNVAHFGPYAAVMLVVLGTLQVIALRRNVMARGPMATVRATRDVAFVAAIVLALAEVLTRQRWAIGATIAAVEFAIVLELFARLAPAPPAA